MADAPTRRPCVGRERVARLFHLLRIVRPCVRNGEVDDLLAIVRRASVARRAYDRAMTPAERIAVAANLCDGQTR